MENENLCLWKVITNLLSFLPGIIYNSFNIKLILAYAYIKIMHIILFV